MSDPFVAVFMVTYNHENYIGEAIESVLMQKTSFPFKLFIGEDCSTDKTLEICKKYEAKHPNTIELLINSRNLGGPENASRVYLACFSSGAKYTAMLEGDDYWINPNKLQKQVNFLEANTEYSMCFHPSLIINEYGDQINILGDEVERTIDIPYLIENEVFIPTSSIVFRNRLNNDFFEFISRYKIISCDQCLHLFLALKGDIKQLSSQMSIYRSHRGGISVYGDYCKIYQSDIILYKNIKKKFSKHFYSSFNYKVFILRIKLSRLYLSKKKIWEGIVYLFIALTNIRNRFYFKTFMQLVKEYLYSVHIIAKLGKIYRAIKSTIKQKSYFEIK